MSLKFTALAACAAAATCAGAAYAVTWSAQPEWSEAPTVADIAAAYPARARAAGVSGTVNLTCEIGRDGHPRDCATLTEKPEGYGFGAAARKIAERLKVEDYTPTHKDVFIPVTFDAAVLKGEAVVTKPAWAELPSAEDFQSTFPKTENGVNDVRVVLGCTVERGGVLSGCAVAEENPPGQGYGAGALALASKFKVSPWGADGAPTIGARIRLPIHYELTPAKPK
jgi:TonB family protein